MDASAYLRSHGWRGHGHSLDKSNRGIKKPLLVSKKVDALGVGLSNHTTVSDQWWLRAFDQGLKSLGTGEESVLANVQKHGVNRGGLYGRFVKGERIAGSIGQTPLSSEAEKSGSNTPTIANLDTADTMAVDIPPEDKLERVVGTHSDKNSHDAMMHLLQHPEAAPAGMRKMLDRKRKRAERPVEKRARRKTEQAQRIKEQSAQKRREAIADGTFDKEQEEEKRRMKEINRRAKEFVLEAQRRGIIPLGPNEFRKGIELYQTDVDGAPISARPDDDMQRVFDQVALTIQATTQGLGKMSLKAQKYAREKAKRELKRAAKAHLMGEKPPHEQTSEEKKAKKAKKKEHSAQKRASAAQEEAEKLARREVRAEQKRQSRIRKKAEKAEVARIMAERDAALAAGKTLEQYPAEQAERDAAVTSTSDEESESDSTNESSEEDSVSTSEESSDGGVKLETNGMDQGRNEFNANADEIKFGMNSKGGKKKIPGVGAVERYPTKAEKKVTKLKALAIKNGISEEEMQARLDAEKASQLEVEQAKVDAYRAMKHGMSLEDYKEALSKGEVYTPYVEKKRIPAEKLAEYKKRAEEKGVKLEEYIRRREKSKAKQSEQLGNPYQRDIMQSVRDGGDYIMAEPEQPTAVITQSNPIADADNDMGFVIDTAGDETLTSFPDRVRATIRASKPLAIVDTAGDESLALAKNMPVPLDPRIWEGKDVKTLPKHIRKARRDWMAARREEKKARASEGGAQKLQSQKKAKGARKIAAREAFVKQILFHSRQALRGNGDPNGMVTIDGVSNVPLVKVETLDGIFKRHETDLARTAARRVLRNVKREERAKKGKGKGWKKRERSEKEAARNAGISGFTTKARFEAGGNKDLLL